MIGEYYRLTVEEYKIVMKFIVLLHKLGWANEEFNEKLRELALQMYDRDTRPD